VPLLQAPLSAGDTHSTLPPYVVFVDAGSTGSRAHVFQISARAPPAFRVKARAHAPTLPALGLALAAPARAAAAAADARARARTRAQAVAAKFSSAVPLASLAGKPPEDVWCARVRTHTRHAPSAPSLSFAHAPPLPHPLPSRPRAAFSPLLAHAASLVPAPLRPRTPLFVWATAGMRLLPPSDAEALYDTLFSLTQARAAFAVSRADGFRTISGRDEGFYGWVAANVLAGSDLSRVMPCAALPPTLGALDLGGGSAQVVSAAGDAARCGRERLRARFRAHLRSFALICAAAPSRARAVAPPSLDARA
jgi:hypothetical protein